VAKSPAWSPHHGQGQAPAAVPSRLLARPAKEATQEGREGKARKPATRGSGGQQQRAADGSARTQAIIPWLPLGLAPWTDGQIQGCESIPVLERRIVALEQHQVDLGMVCWLVEDELACCRKRVRQLKDEKRRPPSKPRRPR
jgi:hypothetical protein